MNKFNLNLLLTLSLLLLSVTPMSAQKWAVRTNALALVTGNINADLSLAISPRVSVHLPIQYRPYTLPIVAPTGLLHWIEGDMSNSQLGRFGKLDHAENLTVMPGLRYWTRGVYNRGLFFGGYAVGKLFKYGGSELLEEYKDGHAIGGGLSVGYSMELSPRLNVEAEIGGGAYWRSYDVYNRNGYLHKRDVTDTRVVLSRIGISLTYLL